MYLHTSELDEERQRMQEALSRNQDEMSEMEKSWQQKMHEREKEFEVC